MHKFVLIVITNHIFVLTVGPTPVGIKFVDIHNGEDIHFEWFEFAIGVVQGGFPLPSLIGIQFALNITVNHNI